MNVELSNGLDHFFQWDKGQKVKIPDGAPTVHFKWGNIAVPFDVVDGWVEIAPELTQKPGDILLWTYKEDHTLNAARIPVERKPKPADYVYTPTEIKTWEQLDKRITALEAANVQANWDQNDASAADYVRGRTHYVGTKHDVRVIKQTSGKFSPELGLIVGNTYRVDYDRGSGFGVGEEFVCKDLNEGKDGIEPAPYVGHANGNGNPDPYLIFDNSIDILPAFDHMVNIKGWKIEGDFASVKTLDLKYIDPKLLERIKALEDGGGVAGVSSVNGQTGAVEITAKGLGALTEDALQSATNAALAQAKASGEFDGAPGAEGPQGERGPTGDTGPQGPAGAGLDVTGATVGQTVKISAVDDNGVPTAWVPVDMESGGTSEVSWHAWDNVIVPEGGLNAFDFTTLASGEKLSDHQVKGMFIYSPIERSAADNDQSATLIVNGDYAFNLMTFARSTVGYLRLLLTVENGQLVVRYYKRDTDINVTFPATTVTINSEGLHSTENLIKGATTVIGYGQTLKTFNQIKSVRIESSGQVAKGVEFDVQVMY